MNDKLHGRGEQVSPSFFLDFTAKADPWFSPPSQEEVDDIRRLQGKARQFCDAELKKLKKLQNLEKTRKINRAKMIPGGPCCTLQDNDAMLERGGKNNQHPGSQRLLGMVRAMCEIYEGGSRAEKSRIIQCIMEGFKSSGGRFLIREDKDSNWYEVMDKPVRDKLGHMLRDQVYAKNKTMSKTSSKQ